MSFFNDLDSGTWVIFAIATGVSALVTGKDFYDWRNRFPIRTRRKRIFLGGFAVILLAIAIDGYNDSSTARRMYINGEFKQVQSLSSRGGPDSMVACLFPCKSDGPLFYLRPQAAGAVRALPAATRYRIEYLDEREDTGKLLAYRVIGFADEATGQRYYQMDARPHPARITLLLIGATFLVLTCVISGRLADTCPDTEDDYENYRENDPEMP